MSVTASDRLLDVVVELLVAGGFEGVSVRKVAQAAGVSIGAVQHHFPTKDAMLRAAMDLAARQFQDRLAERIPPDASAEVTLRLVAEELLGLDSDARPASALWALRVARATVDAGTASQHAREWAEVESLLIALIVRARPERPGSWATDRAAALLALVDGLAISVLVEPDRMPPERARRLLATALDEILATG